ncbi:MAG: MFS transporter [Burkholderiaceae bacterium]
MAADLLSESQKIPSTFEEATYRKVAWRLIPLLLICYVVAYLDRVNVGFAKLQMLTDLKFSETMYGLGSGIFFIGYFIFEIPSNVILHRVGARVWIARIMISWGILSACMMFITTPTMFYVVRFLLGAAEAGFFPGIILYLTYWYPAHRRARMTALFMTAVAISGVIGGPLSGWILRDFGGVNGWAGWQWMFLIEGIPSVLMGIFVLFYLDDRITHAKWLSADEKMLLAKHIERDNVDKVDAPIGKILTTGRVWLMGLIYFSFVMGLYGISFWLPTIIKQTGISDALTIGLLSAIPWAFAVVSMVLVARHADRTGERRWHIAIPGLLGAVGLVLSVLWRDDTVLAMAALTLATAGILTTLPSFWSLPTAFLAGTGAAAGIALINSLGNLAGFVSPFAVGWLKDLTQSTNSGMYLLAGSLVVGAMLTLSVRLPATRETATKR